jgi:TolA-binding protein
MRSWIGAGLVAAGASACGSGFKPDAYPTPVALFEASKEEYQRGNCGGAVRGFTRVVFELPPRDPRMAEARYLLGECRFNEKDYRRPPANCAEPRTISRRTGRPDSPHGPACPTWRGTT